MKDNSCRSCGDSLEVKKTCNICSQVNQLFCHNCGYVSQEQTHLQCMMISLDCTLLDA